MGRDPSNHYWIDSTITFRLIRIVWKLLLNIRQKTTSQARIRVVTDSQRNPDIDFDFTRDEMK